MDDARRVVVLRPCCIGDAVMALPALQVLRATLPAAHITVWTGRHSMGIFDSHPAVDAIQPMPDIPGILDLPALIARLRASGADMLIVLDRSRLLEKVARLSRIQDVRLMQRGSAADLHESACYLGALDLPDQSNSLPFPRIELSEAHQSVARRVVAGINPRFVVLHPGGAENPGARMHSKRWPIENWVAIANWVSKQGMTTVLTGSRDERGLCLEVAARSGAGFCGSCVLAGELGIMESAAVISRARAFVGPDTGLGHLAAATGTPTITIFGPTNPARYAPRGEQVTVLAPGASWHITDTDLRQTPQASLLPTTSQVTSSEVIDALQQAGVSAGSGGEA